MRVGETVDYVCLVVHGLIGRFEQTREGQRQITSLHLPNWRLDALRPRARHVALLGDRPLTIRAGIDNIPNKRYWASAFETFGTSLLQGQSRSFRLSASMGF